MIAPSKKNAIDPPDHAWHVAAPWSLWPSISCLDDAVRARWPLARRQWVANGFVWRDSNRVVAEIRRKGKAAWEGWHAEGTRQRRTPPAGGPNN